MSPKRQNPVWSESYAHQASKLIENYFGSAQSLSGAFPCNRDAYPWADHRPPVVDSRVTAKNNTEYHGLEKQAGQYHAAAMYEEASQHWLMAAYWRQMDKKTHGFEDKGHDQALTFCLKNFEFNQALWAWSSAGGVGQTPVPRAFGLTDKLADRIEREGQQALNEAHDLATRDRSEPSGARSDEDRS